MRATITFSLLLLLSLHLPYLRDQQTIGICSIKYTSIFYVRIHIGIKKVDNVWNDGEWRRFGGPAGLVYSY